MALSKVSTDDRFYLGVKKLRKDLDLLCKEYEARRYQETKDEPQPDLRIINPVTGKPMKPAKPVKLSKPVKPARSKKPVKPKK